MLNQHERRELAALERRLATEDPDLARALQQGMPPRGRLLSSRLTWAVLAVLAVIAGALGLGLVPVVLGLITLVVTAVLPASPDAAPPQLPPHRPTEQPGSQDLGGA